MHCEEVQSLLPDYWHKNLDNPSVAALEAHFENCEACRLDAEMWRKLDVLPLERPSDALSLRLREVLAAYRVGRDYAEREHTGRKWSFQGWLGSWWPAQPVVQLAVTASTLVVGCILGLSVAGGLGRSREITALREELHSTRELVAVSLLRQQSASERLRGINYSSRIAHPDEEVLGALMQALKYDPAVNVKLAAVDALRRYSNRPGVREGLLEALGGDESPMVQAALIDTFVDLHEPAVIPRLQQLRGSEQLDPIFRKRIQLAIEKLQISNSGRQ